MIAFLKNHLLINVWYASTYICNMFYIGKTKKRLNDRKTEHFKTLINRHPQT